MKTSLRTSTEPDLDPSPATRFDSLKAQQVEVGIVFQKMLGTRDAARYFAENGIPLHVALRVLMEPSLRRLGADLWAQK